MLDAFVSSLKMNPYISKPKTAISKCLGFSDIGKIKKSRKVIGLSGLIKQKRVRLAITKADVPIRKLPLKLNGSHIIEPTITLET